MTRGWVRGCRPYVRGPRGLLARVLFSLVGKERCPDGLLGDSGPWKEASILAISLLAPGGGVCRPISPSACVGRLCRFPGPQTLNTTCKAEKEPPRWCPDHQPSELGEGGRRGKALGRLGLRHGQCVPPREKAPGDTSLPFLL